MAENRRAGLAKAWEGPEWMLRGPGRRAVTVENRPETRHESVSRAPRCSSCLGRKVSRTPTVLDPSTDAWTATGKTIRAGYRPPGGSSSSHEWESGKRVKKPDYCPVTSTSSNRLLSGWLRLFYDVRAIASSATNGMSSGDSAASRVRGCRTRSSMTQVGCSGLTSIPRIARLSAGPQSSRERRFGSLCWQLEARLHRP